MSIWQRFRRWYWKGHNLNKDEPCPACPFPHLSHDHARNEMARGGMY